MPGFTDKKHVLGHVYNSTTLAWERMAQPATAGGNGSTQVSLSTGNVQTRPQSTAWATQAGFSVNSSNELLTVGASGSTTVNVSSLAGRVTVDQNSTVWAVQVAGYSTQVSVSGYSTTANVSSLAGRVTVDQNSTVWAVQVAGYSTQVSVSGYSTQVSVSGYSTTANVSSLAGVVRAQNSTIGDFLASVGQNSTVWFTQASIRDSSGVAFNGVTTRPTTNAQGLAVRTVLNDLQSTVISTLGNNSTGPTLVSSVAGLRVKVYAYSITSTAQALNTLTFASSLANPIHSVLMRSLSSGVGYAALSVTPPAWLFATEASSPLIFKITGTTGTYCVGVSYFLEA